MNTFIENRQGTNTINGSAEGVVKSQFLEGEAVQLRRARTEESGFLWEGENYRKVVVKDVLIYDDIDVSCILWFIHGKIEIDLSEAFVSPDILDELVGEFNSLAKRSIKVVEGSRIEIPLMNGYSGMGRMSTAKMACEDIGFKVLGPI